MESWVVLCCFQMLNPEFINGFQNEASNACNAWVITLAFDGEHCFFHGGHWF